MPSARSFKGTIASRGYAEGDLFSLSAEVRTYQASGDTGTETARLRLAREAAVTEIAALIAHTEAEAAEILEFQLAMLEDEALSEPALAAIARGQGAFSAWQVALEAEITTYLASDNEYFRARAADLRDIMQRVLRALTGAAEIAPPPGTILYGDDITPSQFLTRDWVQGGAVVLRQGSAASHVAMLARARGVPMLVGVAELDGATGDPALVDAEGGMLTLSPDGATLAQFRFAATQSRLRREEAAAIAHRAATTADGTPVKVLVNVATPDDVDAIDIAICDGVGLMRTEFLYAGGLPDEETQFAAYRRVVEWARGKPVVIRTVDAGGDKPVPGFTVEEANPFLGLRGIRLALAKPEIFRVQIRALLRASFLGNVSVMLPMVSLASEYRAALDLFREESERLTATKVPHSIPVLGIMVEVPAAAISPELLSEAAFFSIGSNDLTQYVMAAGRDNGAVAGLNDVTHPSVIALIRNVVRYGEMKKIPVSLCGDAGGDPAAIPALLNAGLRSVSVVPAQLPLAKLAISSVRLEG